MPNIRKKTCPVCTRNYYQISKSHNVCETHESWFVTVCDICNQASFSDTRNLCVPCSKQKSRSTGPKGIAKDHRAALREYGIDGE